jgi:TPR repeat protein
VERDDARAVALFRQGCADGEPYGCNNMAIAHEAGRGVEPDAVSALTFFIITARRDAGLARDNLNRLAATLTPDQVAQAEARAERCTASRFADCD